MSRTFFKNNSNNTNTNTTNTNIITTMVIMTVITMVVITIIMGNNNINNSNSINNNSNISNINSTISNTNTLNLITNSYALGNSSSSCLTRQGNEIVYNSKGKNCILLRTLNPTEHSKVTDNILERINGKGCTLTNSDNYVNAESIAGKTMTSGSTLTVNCNQGFTGNIILSCDDGVKSNIGKDNECTAIVNNCTPIKMVESIGLTETANYLVVTDSTGSNNGTQYSKESTTIFDEGTYLKLDMCIPRYAPSGNVAYLCEYNSSTNTYEWQRVSSYATDVTCVPSSCTPAKATEKSGLPLPDYAWVDTSYNNATYGTTSTIGFIEGVYLKLKQCASGYTLTGSLMYQCVKSGDSYEWQSVSGYTDGTCIEDE